MRRYEETFRNIYFQSFGSIESKGDSFFVLLDGSVEVIKKEKDGPFVKLVELGPGAYFGEQALLGGFGGHHAASVCSISSCRFVRVPAEIFVKEIGTVESNIELFERDASDYLYQQILIEDLLI
jgi:CRP-like cAMP-binding protein